MRVALSAVFVLSSVSFAQETPPESPQSSPPAAPETKKTCPSPSVPGPEIKRAFAAQEYGVIEYTIDRSVPKVLTVKLAGNGPIGTYTRDERTPNEELDRVVFRRPRGSSFTLIGHEARTESGIEAWFIIRDETEEAKGTFSFDPLAGTWDNVDAATRILGRHGNDIRLFGAIKEDLCIVTGLTAGQVPGVVARPKDPSADDAGDADEGDAPTPFRCAGTFAIKGFGKNDLKSVACRKALDDAHAFCKNDFCEKCCEVLPTCDCACLGSLVPGLGDLACACFRSGDPCIDTVACHDGPGGFTSSPGGGAYYRLSILPLTGFHYASGVYLAQPWNAENPVLRLGLNVYPTTVNVGPIPAGRKLRFSAGANGISPPYDCTAYDPWMTLAWTGPAEDNADGLIHANMDCTLGRIYFETLCNYPPFGYFDDVLLEVRRQ